MIPAQSNKDMADWTMQGLHNVLPRFFGLGNFFGRLTICLLEDRVRIAMMFVFLHCLVVNYLTMYRISNRQLAQPWYMHAIMKSMLFSVAFVQRWLCLPRWSASCSVDLRTPEMPADGSCPRLYPTTYALPSILKLYRH